MTEKTQIQIINDEINKELADPKTSTALLTTTFKGLTPILMKQAIMEGMILGFTFKNFLQRDVYALPFGGRYSLITSIGYARKLAQKSGQCGKSEPVYTEKDTKIETCSVTVQKKIGEHIGDYTATVYFTEYNTGKNVWAQKPRTMIAKVAEMHALRSAFPEELDKIYVEEEFDKGPRIHEVKDEVGRKDLTMGKFVKNETEKGEENKEVGVEGANDSLFGKGENEQ